MAYPQSGLIKIFPRQGTTTLTSNGLWALNSSPYPQVGAGAAVGAYYDARVVDLANAPCARRNIEKPAASGVYVPDSNTYGLGFDASTIGFEFYDGAYPGPVVATHSLSDADFPMGLTINTLAVHYAGESMFTIARDRSIQSMNFTYAGSVVDTYVPPPGNVLLLGYQTPSLIPSPLLNKWGIIYALRNFGFSIPVTTVVSGLLSIPRIVVSEFFMLANYNTQNFSFTTNTPNVAPGGIIDIADAANRFGVFSDFKIYWQTKQGETDTTVAGAEAFEGFSGGVSIPTNYYLTRTTSQLKFIIPTNLGIPYGGRRLMLVGVGSGVSFYGSVAIQNFNIQLVDGSGIYTLVDNKTNDTYYNRSTSPVTTLDLKIPDPLVKTGFFNA